VNLQPRLMLNLPKKSPIGWQKSVIVQNKTRTRSPRVKKPTAQPIGCRSYQEPLLLKNRQIVMMQTG